MIADAQAVNDLMAHFSVSDVVALNTYIKKTFSTYINRMLGQRNLLFLVYTPALVDKYEIGRNAKLLLTLSNNKWPLGTGIIIPKSNLLPNV